MTTSVPTIAFDYRPSHWLFLALAIVAVLALLALALCAAPLWSKALLMLAALIYFANAMRGLSQTPWTHLTWHAEGHWRLYAGSDEPHIAELIGSTRVGGLLVLRFRLHGRKRFDAVLLPDNLDADTRRRLNVRLARASPENTPRDSAV